MTHDELFSWGKLLAPAIKVIGWVALLLVIVVRYGDRLTAAENSIKSLQDYSTKQGEAMQQIQLNEMRESTILSGVENELAKADNKIDQLEQKH